MNALVPLAYGEMERLAVSIARSNLFGIKTPDQAMVLMMISQAEGRHPALAARDYDIISGRPSKKAEAMLRDFLEGGGKVEWHALSDEKADATFSHPQGGIARITWDMKRVATAQIANNAMYKKFPRQMLRSRTVSEGVRTVWPLATSGLYVPEEAADIPHNGPTIEHTEPEPQSVLNPSQQGDLRSALNADVPLKAAAAATPRPARVVDPNVYQPDQPYQPDRPQAMQGQQAVNTYPRQTGQQGVNRTDDQWRSWLIKLRDAVAVLRYRKEVEDVAAKDTVGSALASGPPWVKREIDAILADAFARFPDEPAADLPVAGEDDDWPELAIAGEDKVGAG